MVGTLRFAHPTSATFNPSLRAKRSNPSRNTYRAMDCFVASLLAMTTMHDSASPRRNPPEFCYQLPALPSEGAGNAGRLVRPLPRVRKS